MNDVGAGPAASLTGDTAVSAATTPTLPRRFTAQADNNDPEIELTWDDPLEDGGADIVGFDLEFKAGEDGEWTSAAEAASGLTPVFEDDEANVDDYEITGGLTFGVTYHFRLRARNAHSPAAPPDEDDIDTDADEREWALAQDTVASSWPARIAAAPGRSFEDGRITVTWVAPDDHGRPITTYRLRWMSGAETEFPAGNVVEVQAPTTEYIMIGPAPAENFEFQVLAVNSLTEDDEIDNTAAGGEEELPIKWSPTSSELDVPVVNPQPNTGNDGLDAEIASDGRATITWRMLADESANDTVEYTVASYDLEWIVQGPDDNGDLPTTLDDEDAAWDDATKEPALPAQALMQRIIGPLPGNTNLFVRVRVVSTVGTKSAWEQTDPDATSIVARAPNHPVLDAEIIGQNVILSWDHPESNGSPILRYELQFKKDEGDFGDHDGDDDPDTPTDVDPDDPDNDVITFGRRFDPDPEADAGNTDLAPVTTYAHENLEGGATFTYRIRTVTLCNDGTDGGCGSDLAVTESGRKWSAEEVATSADGPTPDAIVPGTPTDFTATADNDDDQIELSWTKPSPGSSAITTYQIQRWNGSRWEALPASLGPEDDEYDDSTAERGKTYHYAIRAVSNAGMGEWTQQSFPNAALNAEAPDKPDPVTATVDGQTITLSWTEPAANGDSIDTYEIQVTTVVPAADVDEEARNWGDGTNEDAFLMPDPTVATTYTFSDLTPGTTYYYRVRAVNACNNATAGEAVCGGTDRDDLGIDGLADDIEGEDVAITVATKKWSDEVDAKAEAIAPNAPGAETGQDDDLEAGSHESGEVILSWGLPGPDTNATDDETLGTGGAPITSVEVERWDGSTGQFVPIKVVPVTLNEDGDAYAAGTGDGAYTDPDLDDGTVYTYRVRAVNSAGASGWSNMASGRTAAEAPETITLDAMVDGQDVILSWDEPDDNGASIMRYEIQRFPSIVADTANDDDEDPDVNNDWGDDAVDETTDNDVIVPMPAGVTMHTDRALQPGTTYYYRIRAVNVCNDDNDDNDLICGNDDTAITINPDLRTWSREVKAITAPKAPDKMTLMFGDITQTEITLTWEPPANNGSPISEYQIERWDLVTKSWGLIKDELPASVTSYVDDNDGSDLEAGTRYFYRIRAVNAGGNGDWSTLNSAVTDDAE